MRYAIDLHVHESCMRVAVRVLHSCAFIVVMILKCYGDKHDHHYYMILVNI